MISRSRLMFVALMVSSVVVVAAGLAWACTPAEGGVDDNSGTPGSQTSFSGRYLRPNEPVEVRWNQAGENSPSAPLLATAQANAEGFLYFTVTIPEGEPGSYWIVVNGPNDNWAEGGTRFRASAEYTIEGAAAPQEPNEPPASEEPNAPPRSEEPRQPRRATERDRGSGGGTRTAGNNFGISPEESAGSAGSVARRDDPAGLGRPLAPAGARNDDGDPVGGSRSGVVARGINPSGSSAWNGVTAGGEGARAPSLVPVATGGTQPLSFFAAGAALFGIGLVLMFAGFFVAEIRRGRKAEADDTESVDLLS